MIVIACVFGSLVRTAYVSGMAVPDQRLADSAQLPRAYRTCGDLDCVLLIARTAIRHLVVIEELAHHEVVAFDERRDVCAATCRPSANEFSIAFAVFAHVGYLSAAWTLSSSRCVVLPAVPILVGNVG